MTFEAMLQTLTPVRRGIYLVEDNAILLRLIDKARWATCSIAAVAPHKCPQAHVACSEIVVQLERTCDGNKTMVLVPAFLYQLAGPAVRQEKPQQKVSIAKSSVKSTVVPFRITGEHIDLSAVESNKQMRAYVVSLLPSARAKELVDVFALNKVNEGTALIGCFRFAAEYLSAWLPISGGNSLWLHTPKEHAPDYALDWLSRIEADTRVSLSYAEARKFVADLEKDSIAHLGLVYKKDSYAVRLAPTRVETVKAKLGHQPGALCDLQGVPVSFGVTEVEAILASATCKAIVIPHSKRSRASMARWQVRAEQPPNYWSIPVECDDDRALVTVQPHKKPVMTKEAEVPTEYVGHLTFDDALHGKTLKPEPWWCRRRREAQQLPSRRCGCQWVSCRQCRQQLLLPSLLLSYLLLRSSASAMLRKSWMRS